MSSSEACDCKVGRSIETYGLDDLDEQLRRERADADASLRSLADLVNTQILRAALATADADVVGDAESVYGALTGESVPPERRADVRDQLQFAGVDVDDVESSFVSHQTVRSHLRECLSVDTGRDGVGTVEEGREVIEWARRRDEEIIDRTLSRLRRVDELAIGELEVTHAITVTCADCDDSYRVTELLDRGGCTCSGPEE